MTQNHVTVTIDNETLMIDIEEKERLLTNIIILNQIDATLYTPIDINALLVIPTDEQNLDEYEDVVEKGFVNISITNVNKNITYDEKKISFRNGIINVSMTDQLSVGEYLLTIDYPGTRHYQPAQSSIQFNVAKRNINCQFHDNIRHGYPAQEMQIPISLFDNVSGKTINNCTIHYSFNDIEYMVRTDDHGYATLKFNMPEINDSICDSHYTYELIIDVTSQQYHLQTQTLSFDIDKIDTSIIFYYTNNIADNTLTVEGDVLGDGDGAKYGVMDIAVDNVQYHQQTNIDEYGHFAIDIGYDELQEITTNNIDVYEAQLASPMHQTNIKIYNQDNEELVSPLILQKVNMMAIVKDSFTEKKIDESMVTFIIKKGDSEIYRHVTEVKNGEAYITFNMTKAGNYTIQAFYHGMFNFLSSKSQIVEYTVNNTIEE